MPRIVKTATITVREFYVSCPGCHHMIRNPITGSLKWHAVREERHIECEECPTTIVVPSTPKKVEFYL